MYSSTKSADYYSFRVEIVNSVQNLCLKYFFTMADRKFSTVMFFLTKSKTDLTASAGYEQ